MLAFALALFPLTGITGAGHFVTDRGIQSWCGWAQLATLIAQCIVLGFLRQSIVQHTDLIDVDDVMANSETQVLAGLALCLLVLGLGQYIGGIWRMWPPTEKSVRT